MSDPDPAVVLHLGAHKTASTHLQLALKRARRALASAGRQVLLPEDLRQDGLRLPGWLGAPRPDPDRAALLRAAFAGPAARLVISEENILGTVPGPDLARDGCLYPRAGERLRRLAGLLPPGPVTLALALREGAGFLASCHSQALLAGRVEPFERVFGGVDPAVPGWEDLVDRLQGAIPDACIVVWDHADWPSVAPRVARVLLGAQAPALQWPRGLAHAGLSGAAVRALLADVPADIGGARRMARRLRDELGKDRGHSPYDPWDAGTRARARDAFAQIMGRLASRPGVAVIRPDLPAAG